MTPALVYSPGYDFSLMGFERLHPFDCRKFSRAFALIERNLGRDIERFWQQPMEAVRDEDLLRVHTKGYLDSLNSTGVVAQALEVPALRFLPHSLIERGLLTPMRLAVAGTNLAMRLALETDGAISMNLGGGFHHAFRDHGEGFCLFADVAVAIAAARARGDLSSNDPILIVDLDAHRGNGVLEIFCADPAVHVLDLYNFQNYPGLFPGDPEAFPFQIPLKAQTGDAAYLETLQEELPKFLDSTPRPRLAIYNAGTDIVVGDPVGRLAVSPGGVEVRDRLVIDTLASRGIATTVVTSGGYTERSHELIAKLAITILRNRVEDLPHSGGGDSAVHSATHL